MWGDTIVKINSIFKEVDAQFFTVEVVKLIVDGTEIRVQLKGYSQEKDDDMSEGTEKIAGDCQQMKLYQ